MGKIKIIGIEPFSSEISEDMVNDMLMFYYVGNWDIDVEFYTTLSTIKRSIYAQASSFSRKKGRIQIFMDHLRDGLNRKIAIGGNNTIPPSMTCAVLFALRHEIQHLNQYFLSGNALSEKNVAFDRTTKYKIRPCEVDARASVDRSFEELMALAGA